MSDLDTGLMLKLSADLKRFENQMKKAAQIAGTHSKSMEDRMSGATRKISQTAENSAQVIGREMDRLRSKYDPVFAASKRYEAAVEELNQAQKLGAVNATTYASALARINADFAASAAPIKATGAAVQTTAAAMMQSTAASTAAGGGMLQFMNVSNAGRFVLQNTASQVGDIAVQLEMGTDASRVAAQQLPQLLGGFGSLGGVLGVVAPLLGVVAAVGIPLAAMFISVGDDSEEAAEKVGTFADKLDAAQASLSRADAAMKLAGAGGAQDLKTIYGELTKDVRELADALSEIADRAARVELNMLVDSIDMSKIRDAIGATTADANVASVQFEFDEQSIDAARAQIEELQAQVRTFELTKQPVPGFLAEDLRLAREELALLEGKYAEIGGLADSLARVDLGGGFERLANDIDIAQALGDAERIAEAFRAMREFITEAGIEVEQGLVDELVRAEDVARKAAAQLGDAEANASGVASAAAEIPGVVGAAANEAARLATNLGSAMAALRGVMAGMQSANRVAANRIAAEGATVGKPVERASALARVDANEDSGMAAYAAIRSGSGSAIREVADFVRNAGDGAAQIAAAQAELDAAEAAFKEASKTASGGGGKGGGRGGGRKEEASIFDGADKEIAAIKERIATLGMTVAATARYTAEQELLNAAREAGLSLDAKDLATGQTLREIIAAKADAVGQVTAEFENSRISAENYRDRLDGIVDSLADVAIEGKSMGDVLSGVLQQIGRDLFSSGLESLLGGGGKGGGGILGALLGGFGGNPSNSSVANAASGSGGIYARGAAFKAGRVVPYAKGGAFTNQVVSRPTLAPQALFGEAGPEAIMPLTRGPNGKLGVQSSGGGGSQAVHVTVGVSADSNGSLLPFVQSVTQQGIGQNNAQRDKAFVGKVNSTRANTPRRAR